MKKYLFCKCYKDGRMSIQRLRLSEVAIISQLAQENESVNVECVTVTKQEYKLLFQ